MFAAVAMLVVESLVDMCGESVRLDSIVIKWYNVYYALRNAGEERRAESRLAVFRFLLRGKVSTVWL